MAKQNGIFKAHVGEKSHTLSASTQDEKITEGYKQGLLRSLFLRVFGSITVGGGAADGSAIKLLRSFTLHSSLHGNIIQSMDGLGWYRLIAMLQGNSPRVALSATAHSAAFPIPLGGFIGTKMREAFRINDSALWARRTLLTLNYTIGVLTDLVTGGTPSVTSKVRLSQEYEPNASPKSEAEGGDAPKVQLFFQRLQFPGGLIAGVSPNEVHLPKGAGKRLLALFWSERNSSTEAEVSDVLTPDSTEVELEQAGDLIVNKVRQQDLDDELAQFLGISAMPTGWHGVLLVKDGQMTDWRDVKDAAEDFIFRLNNIATATTRQVYLYPVYAAPVNPGADVATQEAAPDSTK